MGLNKTDAEAIELMHSVIQQSRNIRYQESKRGSKIFTPEAGESLSQEGYFFQCQMSRLLETLEHDEKNAYKCFEVPKPNGKTRKIESPEGSAVLDMEGQSILKKTQRSIADVLQFAALPYFVYGFQKDKSIPDGLNLMLKEFTKKNRKAKIASVLTLDLKNFFPTVSEEEIKSDIRRALFETVNFEHWKSETKTHKLLDRTSELIAKICSFEGRLPQGAPSSPILANLAAARIMDEMVLDVLWRSGYRQAVYGRYADDIVIMHSDEISKEARKRIEKVIEDTGFSIAKEKTSYDSGKPYYNIWGIDVMSEQHLVESSKKLTFKFPTRLAKTYAAKIFSLMNDPSLERYLQLDKTEGLRLNFLTEKNVKSIIGCLSYAYYVTSRGIKKEHDSLLLPQNLAHAWKLFLKKYGDLLPENASHWFKSKKYLTDQYDISNQLEFENSELKLYLEAWANA